MPLAGTGDILGLAMLAAVDAVAGSFAASHSSGVASAAEMAQLRQDIFKALGNATVTHILALAVVTGTATGVTVGAAVVPVVGKVV